VEMRGRATRLREVSAAATRMLSRRAQSRLLLYTRLRHSKSFSYFNSYFHSYEEAWPTPTKPKLLQTRPHLRVL
jgi:hypothetical protein